MSCTAVIHVYRGAVRAQSSCPETPALCDAVEINTGLTCCFAVEWKVPGGAGTPRAMTD